MLETLRDSALLSIGTCPNTGMRDTGIPPHLAIAGKLKEQSTRLQLMEERLTQFYNELTNELPTEIAHKVTEEIRNTFEVNGALPVTMRDIDERIRSLRDEIVQAVTMSTAQIGNALAVTTPNMSVTQEQDLNTRHWWKQWEWQDGLIAHYVPKGWRFPHRVNAKVIFDLWWRGDASIGIRPFRLISKSHDICAQDVMHYTRARGVMNYLESILRDPANNILVDFRVSIGSLSVVEHDVAFNKAYEICLQRIYGGEIGYNSRRHCDLCVGSIFNKIPKKTTRRRHRTE